jgi:hypothetical protein
MGRGGSWPAIMAAAKASPGGLGGGGGTACATSRCGAEALFWLAKEELAERAKLAATACVSASLDATDVTIGDGAILATMIQSDATDYFGTVDNGRHAFRVPEDGNRNLTQILSVREPG